MRKKTPPVRSESCTKAIEEFREWSDKITAREEDWNNGRFPRPKYEGNF